MSDLKIKYEFLKHVKPLDENDIKKILELTNSNPYSFYNAFAKLNNHHTVDFDKLETAKQNINEFVLKSYRIWRKLLLADAYVNNIKSLTEPFLQDPLFNIDSTVFKNSGYSCEQIIRGIQQKYPELFVAFGCYSPIYFQNDAFVHVKSDIFYAPKEPKQKTECRLYLNLKIENVAEFANKVMHEGNVSKLPLYFKFSRSDARGDTFLFYASYEEASKIVELIEKIKAENPKLFDGAENIPPHQGKINGYIGFAEEPTEAKKLSIYEDGASYTEVRADALEELHILNVKIKKENIDLETAKKLRSDIFKKYDLASTKLMFLNKSSVDELAKAGFDVSALENNTTSPKQPGEN